MVDIKKIKPSDLWYVIGYIATDGNLSIDGRHINITSKDREHLYKIRNALLLKNVIGRKTLKISLTIFSASPIFIEWLKDSVEQYFGIPGKLYFKKRKDRKNGHYTLKYGKHTAKTILSKLYYNKCLCLNRKLLQAQLCLQEE